MVFELRESIDEVYELSLLYDFYGEMLADNKKRIYEDYVLYDYSLSEIADQEGISRQGVHDIIKRSTKQLKEFEDKLQLIKKFDSAKEKIKQAKEIVSSVRLEGNVEKLSEVESILTEISNNL